MSHLSMWYYRNCRESYKHVYLKHDRGYAKPDENAEAILEKISHDEKLSQSLSRSRRTVVDLILCNYFDLFVTFTFSKEKVDRYDFSLCKKKITTLFKNYKQRYSPNFRYILVPEFHKDKGIHFHGMVGGIRSEDLTVPDLIFYRSRRTGELKLVPNRNKYIDFPYYSQKMGWFSCSRVKNYEGCARYVAKYITKEMVEMPLGKRLILCSQNLERPYLLFSEDGIPLMCEPDFENEFVRIARSSSTMGLVHESWLEGGRYDYYDEIELDESELVEENILFPRMDGEQLKLYYARSF